MSEEKNKGGRPPTYKTVEEMQVKIDEYFEECNGKPLLDDNGKIMLDKWGTPIILNARPLTITGLAYHLGFTSRQALINYKNKPEFVDAIMRARFKIETYANERLYDKDGLGGAKFTLINNFEGYTDQKSMELSGSVENVIKVIPPKIDEE